MKTNKLMYKSDVLDLMEKLHKLKKYKVEMMIATIIYGGITMEDLKKLKKRDIFDLGVDNSILDRCKSFLDGIKDDEILFPYTTQHINYELRRVQEYYELNDYDTFNTHFFRKCYAYAEYMLMVYGHGMKKIDAIKKLGFRLNHYSIRDTLKYLNLAMEEIKEPEPKTDEEILSELNETINSYTEPKSSSAILGGPSLAEMLEAKKELESKMGKKK